MTITPSRGSRSEGQERPQMANPVRANMALSAARPQVLAALLRYFRDLDLTEEIPGRLPARIEEMVPAWPARNTAGWLAMVSRNSGIDHVRRQARHTARPSEEAISNRGDVEPELTGRIDAWIIATTSSDCCSCAATRNFRLPGRLQSLSASYRARRWAGWRAHFW